MTAKDWASVVALRKESVDRNHAIRANHHKRRVALRKESVDRNIHTKHLSICVIESLSARRAWIEIARIVFVLPVNGVALRKESVDRNFAVSDSV